MKQDDEENRVILQRPNMVEQAVFGVIGWWFRTVVTTRGDNRADSTLITSWSGPHPPNVPVLVMLPGFQGPVSNFHHLCENLHGLLGDRFAYAIVDTLDPGMGPTPEANARLLDAFLDARHLKGRPLYLVGHSMGGLIARCYLHWPERAAHIRGMITIATPHAGVHAWNLAPIHWARSRGFDRRFNANYPLDPSIPFMNISGTRGARMLEGYPNDGVVGLWSVEHARQLAGAPAEMCEEQYYLNHMGLLRERQVAEGIAGFVQTTPA